MNLQLWKWFAKIGQLRKIKSNKIEEAQPLGASPGFNFPGLLGIENSLYTDPQHLSELCEQLSEFFQNVLLGLLGLESVCPGKFKKVQRLAIFMTACQTILNLFRIGVKFAVDSSCKNSPEAVGGETRRRFISKQGCAVYSTETVPFDTLINSSEFFKFMVAQYTVIDAVTYAEPGKSVLDDFKQRAASGRLYADYLCAIKLGELRLVLEINTSASRLVVHPPEDAASCGGWALTHTALARLQSDFVNSLQHKLLIIKGQLWDGYEFLRVSAQELTIPEFFRKDLCDRIIHWVNATTTYKDQLTLLLYGTPGIGKSSAVMAALNRLDAIVIKVDYAPTEALVNFLRRIDGPPKLIIFEEIDVEADPSNKSERMQAILQFLDTDCYDLAIMTSNSVALPPALLRSGRSDLKIQLHKPTWEETLAILANLNEKYKTVPAACFSDAAALVALRNSLQGFSHADLHTLCKLARLNEQTILQYLPEFLKNRADILNYRDAERQGNMES